MRPMTVPVETNTSFIIKTESLLKILSTKQNQSDFINFSIFSSARVMWRTE